MPLKLTMLQLFALTALLAAILQMTLLDPERDPFWRTGVLKYTLPAVPSFTSMSYLAMDGVASDGGSVERLVDRSRELFLTHHRAGWLETRRSFYLGENWEADDEPFDFYDEYDVPKLSFRAVHSQEAYAMQQGRVACRGQLSKALKSTGEDELRRKVAYSAQWQYAPGIILALSSLIVFTWCGRRIDRGNRRP